MQTDREAEGQTSKEYGIAAVAEALATTRAGRALDRLPPIDQIRYQNAATLAWAWLDRATEQAARELAQAEAIDEAQAEGCSPAQAETMGRIAAHTAIDAFLLRLLGLR